MVTMMATMVRYADCDDDNIDDGDDDTDDDDNRKASRDE